jgi:hypothetical protein
MLLDNFHIFCVVVVVVVVVALCMYVCVCVCFLLSAVLSRKKTQTF